MSDFVAGQILTAAALNAAVPDDVWTAWTPAWTSSGVAPSIGNGTLDGLFYKSRKMITVKGRILLGSTSTVGTGNYAISTPLPIDNLPTGNIPHGVAWFRDTSPVGDYAWFCLFTGASTMQLRQIATATNNVWSATVPVAPAVGDWVTWSYTAALA